MALHEANSMILYTDGSFLRDNPREQNGFGHGGWSFCVVEGRRVLYSEQGGESGAGFANGRMELVAVYQALRYIEKTPSIIYCDSEYVVKGFNEWCHAWAKNNFKNGKIKFVEIWKMALQIRKPHHEIKWVKAHSNDFGNEKADVLARGAASQQRDAWQNKQ